MKRQRGRQRRQQNPVNRSYDSQGPDVRVRGTAIQIYDKYMALARDAVSAGDRVMAENYQQHGEHYYRILQSFQQPAAEPSDTERAATNNKPTDTNGEAAQPLVLNVSENGAADNNADTPPPPTRRRGPLDRRTDNTGAADTEKAPPSE